MPFTPVKKKKEKKKKKKESKTQEASNIDKYTNVPTTPFTHKPAAAGQQGPLPVISTGRGLQVPSRAPWTDARAPTSENTRDDNERERVNGGGAPMRFRFRLAVVGKRVHTKNSLPCLTAWPVC